MITATTKAKDYLAEAMEKVQLDSAKGECFRIQKESKNRLALVACEQDENDVAITHGDATILVIEPTLADLIGDRELDVKDAGQGQKALVWV